MKTNRTHSIGLLTLWETLCVSWWSAVYIKVVYGRREKNYVFFVLRNVHAPDVRAVPRKFLDSIRFFIHSLGAEQELDALLLDVVRATNQGVAVTRNVSSEPNWSFGQSFFFAGTVVTTIGNKSESNLHIIHSSVSEKKFYHFALSGHFVEEVLLLLSTAPYFS